MTSSREAWIDLTTDARLPTQALYREDKADRYSHHLCLQHRSALNRPLAGSSVITMTTAELANIPLFKALVETLREMEEADIWGRSLGYLVCQMCGAKVTVGERFVHKDGCPYGVLVPFKEDNDDCI